MCSLSTFGDNGWTAWWDGSRGKTIYGKVQITTELLGVLSGLHQLLVLGKIKKIQRYTAE